MLGAGHTWKGGYCCAALMVAGRLGCRSVCVFVCVCVCVCERTRVRAQGEETNATGAATVDKLRYYMDQTFMARGVHRKSGLSAHR